MEKYNIQQPALQAFQRKEISKTKYNITVFENECWKSSLNSASASSGFLSHILYFLKPVQVALD